MPEVPRIAVAVVFVACDSTAFAPGTEGVAGGCCSSCSIHGDSGTAEVVDDVETLRCLLAAGVQELHASRPASLFAATDQGAFFDDLGLIPHPRPHRLPVLALRHAPVLAVVLECPGVCSQGHARHPVPGIPGVGVAAIGQQVAFGVVCGHCGACGAVVHAPRLAGGVSGFVRGLHCHILLACSHGRQALKRAVGTHAGVLTVDRDIGWLVDLAPELGAAACGLAHELVEVIVGAVRVRQPSCTARIAGLVVSFIFFVAGAY